MITEGVFVISVSEYLCRKILFLCEIFHLVFIKISESVTIIIVKGITK